MAKVDSMIDALATEVKRISGFPVYTYDELPDNVIVSMNWPTVQIVTSLDDGIKLEQTWTIRLTHEGWSFTQDAETEGVGWWRK